MAISVLLVDDEQIFIDYIKQASIWKKGKFEVVGEAKSVDEAIGFLKKKIVDIVIMDISMPEKNGVELSAILSTQYPQITMIVLSSYDDYDYVRETLKNGAVDYILKSRFTEDVLERVLESAELNKNKTSLLEKKQRIRQQTAEWLFHDGIYPFTSDYSRVVSSLIKIHYRRGLADEKHFYLERIAENLEETSDSEIDLLTLVQEPDQLIVIWRFYHETSESKIQELMNQIHTRNRDFFRQTFQIDLDYYLCPFFFRESAMKSFICHKMTEKDAGAEVKKRQISLTLNQQNQLLSAIEQFDGNKAEEQVYEIYDNIGEENEAGYLFVTRELLEILERITKEYETSLDFIPQNAQLLKYINSHSRNILVMNIAGLYRNVLRELKEKNSKVYSSIVSQAIQFMEDSYHLGIGLSEIASSIGVNSSYLSRVFHEETGIKLTEWLNRIRIETAKELISEGVNIKDIVNRCGFKHYSYFLKIFKEVTGMTTKEYMETLQSGE